MNENIACNNIQQGLLQYDQLIKHKKFIFMIYFQERLLLFYNNNKTDNYSQKFIFFWLFGFMMEKTFF
jgi:hypothetical protein